MRLLSLVGRECHSQIRSAKFVALVASAALLAFFSVRSGIVGFTARLDGARQLVAQRASDQARTGGRVSGTIVEPGLRVIRLPSESSVFVRGMDELLPAYWDFGPSHTHEGPSAVIPQAAPGVGGTLDLEFLVRVALGLLALIIGLDAIAIDRESGTLTALIGQPIPSSMIVGSKVAGGLVVLTAALGIVLAGTALGAEIWFPAGLDRNLLSFLGRAAGISLLYLATVYSAGLAIAAICRSTRVSQSVGMLAWLYVALIAPSFVPLIGAFNVQSRQTVEAQLKSLYERESRVTAEVLGDQLVALRPSVDEIRASSLPPRIGAELEPLRRTRTQELRNELNALERRAGDTVARQRRAFLLIAALSPATEFTDGIWTLAGTGRNLQTGWETTVRAHQERLNAVVFDDPPRIGIRIPVGDAHGIYSFARHEHPAFRDITPIDAPTSDLRARLWQAAPNALILLAYSGVLLTVAFAAFRRSPL